MSGSYILAVDVKTGRQRWKTARPAATVGFATPIVYRPAQGPAHLVVLGTTRLDGYQLAIGEPRWWIPLGSMGGAGTPVATADTVLISTLNTNEPWMTTFDAALKQYDKDHDGRIS